VEARIISHVRRTGVLLMSGSNGRQAAGEAPGTAQAVGGDAHGEATSVA
jgi:hypothetical protein